MNGFVAVRAAFAGEAIKGRSKTDCYTVRLGAHRHAWFLHDLGFRMRVLSTWYLGALTFEESPGDVSAQAQQPLL